MDLEETQADVLDVLWLVVPWLDDRALRAARRTCSFVKLVVDNYVDHKTCDRVEAAWMLDAPRIGMLGMTTISYKHIDHVRSAPDAWQWATRMYLFEERLSAVPGVVGRLANLTFLDLRNNHLTDLPPGIAGLLRLQNLNLDGNKFVEIPAVVWQLTQLRHLVMCHNELRAVPDEIAQLANLRHFDLSGNPLAHLSPEIEKLTRLEQLYLLNTIPMTFPDVVGRMESLRVLSVSSNRYGVFPDAIAKLTRLEELDMKVNQLAALPDTIGRLVHLKKLYLSNNRFGVLPDGFASLTQLRVLDLSGNQFNNVPDALVHLTQLRDLYLRGNEIGDLPPWIERLSQLHRLDLQNNRPRFRLPASMHNTRLYAYLAFTPMDGRIDAIAQRASGMAADDVVARVLAALEAGAPGGAGPESFEVLRTNHRARALWTLHQCRRHCPDFYFALVVAPLFCFGTSYTIAASLRETRPRSDTCAAHDAEVPGTCGSAAGSPADASGPDSARLQAVLERLAGDTRDALVAGARALVAADAFADGAATLRADLGLARAKAIVHLVRPALEDDGFVVYKEFYTKLRTSYAVRIAFDSAPNQYASRSLF